MSESFNGYHVWLGIPPSEQPPNHYRLLGIAIFETDLDVIDHAADRQMAHVRTFQAGRHGALSQRILNELAAARVCLLHPDRKPEYDAQLRAKLAAAPQVAAVPVAAVPVGKAIPVTPVAQPAIPTATPTAIAATKQPNPQPSSQPKPAQQSIAAAPTDADADADFGLDDRDERASGLVDDYDRELSAAAGSSPLVNPLAVRRSSKSDLALQRAVTYTLVCLAVGILLMIGYQLIVRLAGPTEDWFRSSPAANAAAEDDLAPQGPKAPAPAPPGGR